MKQFVLGLILVLSVSALHAELEFAGLLVTSERTSFVLSAEGARNSGWITFGQKFDGYTIVAFEPQAELLVIEKDGRQQKLRLRASKITEAKPEDRKARLRSLQGMELAYELAKDDPAIADMLVRYHEALLSIQKGQRNPHAVAFLKSRIEKLTADKAAQVRAEK